ncbi:MAG: hypothetical protein ABIP54_04330 [Candidatus Andersenbacteria bacterium]
MATIYYVTSPNEVKPVVAYATIDFFLKSPKEIIVVLLSGVSNDYRIWTPDSFEYVIRSADVVCWKKSMLSQQEAETAVAKYEKSLIPVYQDTTVEINKQIVHHFFDANASVTNGFREEIERAISLVIWLFEKSREELFDAQELARDFPFKQLDWRWPIEASMWTLLHEALKKERKVSRETSSGSVEFRSHLAAMLTVLREIQPLAQRESFLTFISLLRAPLFNNTVIMGITVWKERNNVITQQRITHFPSMWLYRVMHPGCCVAYERISMLMHSITSHAAVTQWPDAQAVRVSQPMPKMLELFRQGAKEHKFNIVEKYSELQLPFRDDNYIMLWRKWTSPSIQQSLCAICWKVDANWQCGAFKCPKEGYAHYYCSSECAKHDWHRHVAVDGCKGKF